MMFGTNEKLGTTWDRVGIEVKRIFYTIQGEGPYAGHPAVFIRLAGCNLACSFCDTDFAGMDDGAKGTWLWSPQLILDCVKNHTDVIMPGGEHVERITRLVVLTGGEPFRQNILPLVRLLNEADYHVQVETAGTLYPLPEPIDPFDPKMDPFEDGEMAEIVCSPKTPRIHPRIRALDPTYKYIVSKSNISRDDGLPIGVARPDVESAVFVQPMDVKDEKRNADNVKTAVNVAMRFGYRLSLQVHKIVGVD